jgi:hypothetical protein
MEAVAAEVKRRIPRPVFIRWKLPNPSDVNLTYAEISALIEIVAANGHSDAYVRAPGFNRLAAAYLEALRVIEGLRRGKRKK